MTHKTIEITVSPTGQSSVQTKGFVGGECREASRFIEEALGQRVSESLTAEFHQAAQHQLATWDIDRGLRLPGQDAGPAGAGRPASW